MPWIVNQAGNIEYVPRHSYRPVQVVRSPGFLRYEASHQAITNDSPLQENEEMAGFNGMLNTFMVGCDPEFVALDGAGKALNLANYWNGSGEIGFDHGGRVGELRPEATKGTYALTKKLRTLINSAVMTKLNASKLRAGAVVQRDTLGGHIHFGIQTRTAMATPALTNALDRVTTVLEHLDILPKAESETRRKGGHYGRLSDVRDSNGHIEYRSMASWLTDPKVAYLCLTAAKLAACDPAGTLESLKANASFADLEAWLRRYRTKDINARRAIDRVVALGHKTVQVYPDVDFRERWRELGI